MRSRQAAALLQVRLELDHDPLPFPVVTDVRDAIAPCILIPPPETVYDLACGPSLTWTLVLVAPGPGNADAWDALDRMLEMVEASDVTPERARPGSYTLQAGTDPQPCLYVTLTPEGT